MAVPWTCPHCQRHATIGKEDYTFHVEALHPKGRDGQIGILYDYNRCPNPACGKHELIVTHGIVSHDGSNWKMGKVLSTWRFSPRSKARPFPDYVPAAIRTDYEEACLIADLSPKASATLARRCLQGILRDFWKIKPGNLFNEINEIKDKCDPLTWDAIEAVRKVGNIGAHMESDIDVIINVEVNEAELLLQLIETLVADWYVAREDRKKRLSDVAALANKRDGATAATGGATAAAAGKKE